MKYSHVIWDWNGTIVNDAQFCVGLVNELLLEFNQEQVSLEFYLDNFQFPVSSYYSKIGLPTDPLSSNRISSQFIINYRRRFQSCLTQHGVRACISKLNEFNVNQSVLSAGNQIDLNTFVSHYELSPYFNFISGVSDFFAHGKSDIAQEHFNKLGLPSSNVLLVGDTLHDAEIAKKIGVNCLLYCGGHNSKKVLHESTFPVIESIDEVINWVLD
jgi:phosphoglycolate phosphatase